MIHAFLKRLERGVLVNDGAMGTMLLDSGMQTGTCPEEWNVSHPEIIKQIHKKYFSAGCDMVTTNTFGGTRFKLKDFSFENKTKDFNFCGAKLAKEAAPEGGFVSLSVGPTGKFIEPLGEVSYPEMVEVFSEQIRAGVEGGVDVICIETMYDLKEAKAAIEAAKKTCELPIIATMTFDKTKNGFKTMMGVEPKDAVSELSKFGADVVGSNCGTGIDEMIELMKEMRSAGKDFYLIAQPNAGMPIMQEDRVVYKQDPEYMAKRSLEFLKIGVNVVGGCCGTTPEHIKHIVASIRGYEE
jgi:5-methyltetrahydrofolate--homocysteine methyltransferase